MTTRYRLRGTDEAPERTFDTLGQAIDHVIATEERDDSGLIDFFTHDDERPNGRLKYILRDDLLVVHVDRDQSDRI